MPSYMQKLLCHLSKTHKLESYFDAPPRKSALCLLALTTIGPCISVVLRLCGLYVHIQNIPPCIASSCTPFRCSCSGSETFKYYDIYKSCLYSFLVDWCIYGCSFASGMNANFSMSRRANDVFSCIFTRNRKVWPSASRFKEKGVQRKSWRASRPRKVWSCMRCHSLHQAFCIRPLATSSQRVTSLFVTQAWILRILPRLPRISIEINYLPFPLAMI